MVSEVSAPLQMIKNSKNIFQQMMIAGMVLQLAVLLD